MFLKTMKTKQSNVQCHSTSLVSSKGTSICCGFMLIWWVLLLLSQSRNSRQQHSSEKLFMLPCTTVSKQQFSDHLMHNTKTLLERHVCFFGSFFCRLYGKINWGSDPAVSGAPSYSLCPECTLIPSGLCTENCLCVSFL